MPSTFNTPPSAPHIFNRFQPHFYPTSYREITACLLNLKPPKTHPPSLKPSTFSATFTGRGRPKAWWRAPSCSTTLSTRWRRRGKSRTSSFWRWHRRPACVRQPQNCSTRRSSASERANWTTGLCPAQSPSSPPRERSLPTSWP
ncbi:unnamed protein product, partial [Phaeothamnion confervicola]